MTIAFLVAWYQSAVSVTYTKEAANASLTVAKTSGTEDQLDAEIHFFADTTGLSNIEFTAWGTNEDASKLFKGVVPTGGTNADVRLTEVTIAGGTLLIPVKAYITDTSSEAEQGQIGHASAWAAALDASNTTTKKVTYSYSNSDETVTNNSSKLLTAEVLFYTTDATADYAKASEGISGATGIKQNLDVAVSELKVAGSYVTTAANAVTIGFLHVRFSGTERLHTSTVTYTAEISASAGDGAAS